MDSQYEMISHELYYFLYNSNQTIHETPIECSTDNNVPVSYNSNTNNDQEK